MDTAHYPKDRETQVFNPHFVARVRAARNAEAAARAAAERRSEAARRTEAARARLREVERDARLSADVTARQSGRVTLARIIALAGIAYGVRQDELMSRSKADRIVRARHFVCYWACRLTSLSLPRLGQLLGRDHTTILHGARMHPERRARQGRYLRPARQESRT